MTVGRCCVLCNRTYVRCVVQNNTCIHIVETPNMVCLMYVHSWRVWCTSARARNTADRANRNQRAEKYRREKEQAQAPIIER
jgi:hypothetical protein